MKRNVKINRRIATLSLLTFFFAACNDREKRVTTSPAGEVRLAALSDVVKPTNAVVRSSIKTILPEYRAETIVERATGIITYDTKRMAAVPTHIGGRIEKLYISTNFQTIARGERIMDIYSPELVTAQREFIYLLTADPNHTALIAESRRKLLLLGVTEQQLDQIAADKKEIYAFTICSPTNGFAIDLTEAGSGNALGIRAGRYVRQGETLFGVASTTEVWGTFEVPGEAGWPIKIKDPVKVIVNGEAEEIPARVEQVLPFFKEGQRFVSVRVPLHNETAHLRIGALATATFSRTADNKSLWIPRSASIALGTRQVVFLKWRGLFRPKEVSTGRHAGNWVEVVAGLNPTDSLAANAQYLVDSESFIKVSH